MLVNHPDHTALRKFEFTDDKWAQLGIIMKILRVSPGYTSFSGPTANVKLSFIVVGRASVPTITLGG